MFSSPTDSRSPSGAKQTATDIPATTRSGMEKPASRANVPSASPCPTSITHGSRSRPLTATSFGRPRHGHSFVPSEQSLVYG